MTEAKTRRKPGFLGLLVALAVVGGPLLWAPSLIRGFAARDWVDHYAAVDSLPRPHKAAARAIAEKANIAVQNLAPLPQASATAMRALEVGQRFQAEDHDREAALVIYQGVRAACAEVRSRPLSGTGFAVVEARAAALEDSARDPGRKSDAAK